MGYIDPDLLHSALDNFSTFVDDNDALLTSKGLTTATVKTNLTNINTDLTGKKKVRDNQRTSLTTAQQAFAASAAVNYTAFSDAIDSVAGALGKKTPSGKQVLGYRKHVLKGKHATPSEPVTEAAPAKKPVSS
jgi:hypothetical protein